MLTLWDIMMPKRVRSPKRRPKVHPKARPEKSPSTAPAPGSAQARYEEITKEMLDKYGIRVRKWRSSMSGVAWEVSYKDGTVSRLIESPRPKGPMSAAVFLHEVGHHAIGFSTYSPRCLEEFYAWKFSIDTMRELDLNVTQRVLDRMHDSLHYAIEKARRRGLKRLPQELIPYVEPRAKLTRELPAQHQTT
ncbi:MAG: hypothetical protein AB8F26_02200 [Phycisphaerales bacterium]